jgi:LysR family cyn operon transcriptional activator
MPMMESELDWAGARLFLTVCRAGGITAAVRAGTAGLSQPALSTRMQALEQSVGTSLFERKPFRLTAAGARFRDEFETLLRRAGEALERIQREHGNSLRVAASDVVINLHLPALLAAMKLPADARLTLRDAPSGDLPALVRDEEVDIAFGIMTAEAGKGRSPLAEVLMDLPFGLIHPDPAAASSPVAAWKELRSKLIAGDPPGLIGLSPSSPITVHLRRSLEQHGLAWPVTVEVSSLAHSHAYVALGLGYAIALSQGKMKPPGWFPIAVSVVPPLRLGAWYGANPPPLARRLLQVARRYTRNLAPV